MACGVGMLWDDRVLVRADLRERKRERVIVGEEREERKERKKKEKENGWSMCHTQSGGFFNFSKF